MMQRGTLTKIAICAFTAVGVGYFAWLGFTTDVTPGFDSGTSPESRQEEDYERNYESEPQPVSYAPLYMT